MYKIYIIMFLFLFIFGFKLFTKLCYYVSHELYYCPVCTAIYAY